MTEQRVGVGLARVDVHQHVVPPAYREALPAHGGDPSGWKIPDWSPEAALMFMDTLGIATGILSVTCPGVSGWGGDEACAMARAVNDYAAGLVAERPERFGTFATLPLPDIQGSLQEIARVIDVLNVDGIVLLSNYRGIYLGDPLFDPIWEELDRRKAVVFVHPNQPIIPQLPGIPGPAIDFPFDTTRAAVQMTLNGHIRRFAQTKVILSHAGGFLPYASERFAELAHGALKPEFSVEQFIGDLRQFYFDIALSSSKYALPSLLAFAEPGHVLFGSDFPYAPPNAPIHCAQLFDEYDALPDDERLAINRGSALSLFPRLAERVVL
jgi:predicted TIM-barrel fold metal-dependent hydrolase